MNKVKQGKFGLGKKLSREPVSIAAYRQLFEAAFYISDSGTGFSLHLSILCHLCPVFCQQNIGLDRGLACIFFMGQAGDSFQTILGGSLYKGLADGCT